MEDIKQILGLLVAVLYLMGLGVLYWKIANYIGNKLHFAEIFLSLLQALKRKNNNK